LGRISFDVLNNLSDKIIQSKPQDAIEFLEKIYNNGNEPSQILTNMLGYLKNLLIVKNCEGDSLLANLTQLNNTQIESLKTQSEHIETHQITFLIEKIVYYIKELKTTTSQYLWLEVAMIDLANLTENTSLLALQERVSRLESVSAPAQASQQVYVAKPSPVVKEAKQEEKVAVGVETPTYEAEKEGKGKREKDKESVLQGETENPSAVQPLSPSAEDEAPMPLSKPAAQTDGNLISQWHELLQNISSPPVVSLLTQHARPIEISGEKVVIGCKENFLKMLGGDNKRASIEEAVNKLFGKNVSVVIKSSSAEDFSADEKKNVNEERGTEKSEEERVKSKENSIIVSNTFTSEAIPTESPSSDEINEIDEDDDFIEHELAKKIPEKFVPSDQVSMVMNLFDGKYIE
jgi:DNA polymerase-3 subunit gamma/tau